MTVERMRQWEDIEPRLMVYLGSFRGLAREDMEEILQRSLLALWRRNPDLDARSWLYGVTRNSAIDVLRSKRRDASRRLDGEAGATDAASLAASPYPGPEASLLDAEKESFVAAFIAGLDDCDKELLHLAFAEDFSYSGIAALTGRSLGTVKWRMAGLKRRLAARYRKEFE